MRWSAFARARHAIASSLLMTSTSVGPWPSRTRRNNPRLRLRYENGLQNRLAGIAYEHTSRNRPGTRLLQDRPGEWPQYHKPPAINSRTSTGYGCRLGCLGIGLWQPVLPEGSAQMRSRSESAELGTS